MKTFWLYHEKPVIRNHLPVDIGDRKREKQKQTDNKEWLLRLPLKNVIFRTSPVERAKEVFFPGLLASSRW